MNLGWLLDTNVASEPSRPSPEARVEMWLRARPTATTFLSTISIGELRKGIELLSEGKRRVSLKQWFHGDLLVRTHGRVLPVTQRIAEGWGFLTAKRLRLGDPLGVADGLIAATALENDLAPATRNTKHFLGLDLPLLNPWNDPPHLM